MVSRLAKHLADRTQGRLSGMIVLLLALCLSIFSVCTLYTQSAIASPKNVVEQLCTMEKTGRQLSSGGWREMAPLMESSSTKPPLDEMVVIRDCKVVDSDVKSDKATIVIEYTTLGLLDSRNLSFGPRGPHPIKPEKVTLQRTLVLTSDYTDISPNGVVKQVAGTPAWRIQGQAELHIGVRSAISYLRRLRANTTDRTLKKRADDSITALVALQGS